MAKDDVKDKEVLGDAVNTDAPINDAPIDDTDAMGAEGTDAKEQFNIFDSIMSEESIEDKTREDIIKEVVASGRGRIVKDCTIRNVVVSLHDGNPFISFVIKETVIGDTRDKTQVDAFGEPIVRLGKTHNIITGVYAVASVMKDTPRMAPLANKLVRECERFALEGKDTNYPAMLFAGGKISILMEYAPANESYTNPFATDGTETKFTNDKMIHHVIGLEFGDTGRDVYREMLKV